MTAAEHRILSELVEREQGRLLGFIRRLRSATSWLFTVARNRITDHYRKKKTVPFSEARRPHYSEEEPLMLEEILPALTRSPEDEFMRGVIWEEIESTLDMLPEAQREVFIMNELRI